MALASLTLFDSLQAQLPVDIEFRRSGGMVVIETDAEMRSMETYVRAQQETGLDVRLLDRDQALALEPNLSPGIKGCAFSPIDAQVNPIKLTLGFVLEAGKNHVTVMTRTQVLGILTKGGTVTGVRTDRGEVRGDVVVNAAGALAGRVCRMLDISLPVLPRRGQIVVTGPARPVIRHCLISARYIAAKYDPSPAEQAGHGISMEQTGNGNLLLGSTREFAGFNRQTTLSGIRTTLSGHGLDVLVIDENPHMGGQLLREQRPPRPWFGRLLPDRAVPAGYRLMNHLRTGSGIQWLFEAQVLGVFEGNRLWVHAPSEKDPKGCQAGAVFEIQAETILFAAGARERYLPFKGWTLPNVMSLGAAQILMKSHGVLPAGPTLIAGSSPLMMVLAAEIVSCKGRVAGLVDENTWKDKQRFLSLARHHWPKPGRNLTMT